MALPSLALALSAAVSNVYFPPTPKAVKRNAEIEPIDLSSLEFEDSVVSLIPKFDLFNVIIVKGMDTGLSAIANSTVLGFSNGIVNYCDDVIKIYVIDRLTNVFSLAKSIKSSFSRFQVNTVINLQIIEANGRTLMIYLTSDRNLYLFDLELGVFLHNIKLHFNYHTIQHIQCSNLVALYSSASYFTIIKVDFDNLSLHQCQVIYLDFSPCSTIQLPNDHLYVIGRHGRFQVFQYNSLLDDIIQIIDKSLICDIPNTISFGKPNFGRLVKIEALNNNSDAISKQWLCVQETGWTVYSFDHMKLTESISSPLLSRYENLVQLKNSFFIEMANGDIMYNNSNNVQLLSCDHLVKTFKSQNKFWGIFKANNDELQVKSFNVDLLNWDESISKIEKKDISSTLTDIIDGDFSITSDSQNRAVLKTYNGEILCKFNGFKSTIRKVIDLSYVIQSEKSDYLLTLDSSFSMEFLEFEKGYVNLITKIPISMNKVSNVYFYETINCLEFTNLEGSFVVNVLKMSVTNGSIKNKNKMNKSIVFKFSDLNEINDDVLELTHWNSTAKAKLIPLKLLLDNNELKSLLRHTFESKSWLGITSSQMVFYNLSMKPPTIPELVLLHQVAFNERNVNLQQSINCSNSIYYIKKLCELSLTSDMSDISMKLLKNVLNKNLDPQLRTSLFDSSMKTLSNPLSSELDILYSSLILGMIVSIDNSLYTEHVSKILMKQLSDHLLKMDERICEFVFHILSELDVLIIERANENCFDLFQFFKHIMEIRNEFLLNKSRQSFNGLRNCTLYLDNVFCDEPIILSVIMGTILVSNVFPIKSKNAVIDYINYVVLEKYESLNATCLLLILNSIIILIRKLHMKEHHLHADVLVWERINLVFNILGGCFKKTLTFSVALNKEGQLDWMYILNSKKKFHLCFLIPDKMMTFGYIATVTSFIDNKWKSLLLKGSSSELRTPDKERSTDFNIIFEIQKKLGLPLLKFQNPVFSLDQRRIAVVNNETFEIFIWNLEAETQNDNVNMEILKNDNIPLKAPNFYIIILQILWSEYKLTERFGMADLTTVVSQFHQDLETPHSETVRPERKISFAELFLNYHAVFDSLVYECISVRWEAGNRILLLFQEKVVFVYDII